MKRLVIIDGKSVFYRGYYAMGALSTSEGVTTGGIYGFAAIAMEIVRELDPTKVVVAWDSKSSTSKRKAIFAEYKAGRKKPEEDFYAQIPYLKELILALGWGFMEVDNYEADDIIGTLSRQADEITDAFNEVPVLSSDNSLSTDALLSRGMSNTASSATPVSANSLEASDRVREEAEKNGLWDRWETIIVSSDLDMLQVVDENTHMYRVLKGFSKLEEMDIAAVEAKYGIKKAQFLDLKALKGDASDNIPGVPGVGEKTAVKLLNEYGTLKGVYEALKAGKISGKTAEKLQKGEKSAKMSYKLAKIMTDAPVKLSEVPDLVVDKERIVAALNKLEFRSLVRKFFAAEKGAAAEKRAKQAENGLFGDLGEKSASRKGAKRGKTVSKASNSASQGRESANGSGMAVLAQQTLEVVQEASDGTLVSWDIKALMHKNEEVAQKVLAGAKYWDLGQGRFLLEPLRRVVEYGEELAEYERQQREFAELPELYKIFTQFDLPLIPVLYRIEKKGMLIDRGYFAQMRQEFEAEVGELEKRIWQLAGVEFNLNSPYQLSEVLFERLMLPTKGIKKTARGYSTGVKELDKLEGQHEIIGLIKEYREAAKLLSTYIVPLPELADKEGRVHTTYNQNVTVTGRLSSTNPNLQNIPVRSEVGKRIRMGFVAPAGKILVGADYSQFELRLAAEMAGDEELIKDFNAGVDIHTKTASEAFGVPMTEVTKAQRRAAKVINFGVLYGMSVRGLSQAAEMSYAEAKEFIEKYFEVRKPIKEYLEKVLAQAREVGYVETMFGRRRPTPDVQSSNFIIRSGAERAAQNMPIQGTEADLMKRAMIEIDKALRDEFKNREGETKPEMIVQVHDSVIVECLAEDVERVGEILQEKMEGVAPELGVKLAVEVKIGSNWGEV